MFRKILIANRGEIACRVAATARRLGVRTVAVYSDVDRDARHVHACDEAVAIGAAPAGDSYLRGEVILAAALEHGAEAIHPGYGFLSENAGFAEACAAAGLVFIGPPAAAIRAMGLKSAAKQLMAAAGVPLVPGYHGADQDAALLGREAERIGFPVLIKASAGGGGKGMRVVAAAADFAAALAACQREAHHSFGDDTVLIERYLTRPRHIEVQVFGDTHGALVHLGDRDCSVQRRHQKVLEEAPAPGLSAERRAEMAAAALAAARAVDYVGAGTVEFIAEPTPDGRDLQFYFMEMNTRLQVEHPVTEAITGIDLVEWQLRVAAGEPLPLRQEQVAVHGHAIEARICAENPDAGFLPTLGTLAVFRTPPAREFTPGVVRLDTGVGQGDRISAHYDSMIAKLIVHGEHREEALRRLDVALEQCHLAGIQSNVAFLRRLVRTHAFCMPDLDTALIEREHAALFDAPGLAPPWIAAAIFGWLLYTDRDRETADPLSRRDSFRLHGVSRRRLDLEVAGQPGHFWLEQDRSGARTLASDRERLPFEIAQHSAPAFAIRLGGQEQRMTVYAHGDQFSVFAPGGSATVRIPDSRVLAGPGAGPGHGDPVAPMPGKVIAVLVEAGQSVAAGAPLAVIEAMKMEHTVVASRAGRVVQVRCATGDQIGEGEVLIELEAAPAEQD